MRWPAARRGTHEGGGPHEVAQVIADVIEQPRAEVYTRPAYRDLVAAYFTTDDLGEFESRPPFTTPTRRS